MGTKEGGKLAAKKNMELYGKDWYKKLGRLGGLKSRGGGYSSEKVGKDGLTGRERASVYGAIGGKRSRRKKAQV